jgi:N-acetylneuraminate lyase
LPSTNANPLWWECPLHKENLPPYSSPLPHAVLTHILKRCPIVDDEYNREEEHHPVLREQAGGDPARFTMKAQDPLRGLITATFTPMHADASVALKRIPAYAEWLVKEKVNGVFVNGTTGEGQSLTLQERMQVVEDWQSALAGRLPVVVHVGHTALGEAQALARHAEEVGAAGIATLAPYFFKPGLRELVEFCREVAAAAPATPFYYYHMPSMTGVTVPVTAFLEAAASQIPTLTGVKFTFEDLMDLQNASRVGGGRFNILFGRDEVLLAGLALGCTGAVGSTYNLAAPLYQRIIAAYQRGDMAAAQMEQWRAAQFITVMVRHGGLVALKAMMKMAGMDCGPLRLPMRTLGDGETRQLEADLRAIGFFEWARM